MATQPRIRSVATVPATGPRWELLQRIAASALFQKSNRARELLLFVGKHSLEQPDVPLHEQEIGVEVFGREANYDTSQDTLVRVQASQLRKKLQQYFGEEGRDEAVVVEMPKGSYTLAFSARAAEGGAEPEAGRDWKRDWRLGWLVAGLMAVVAVALVLQNVGLERKAEYGLGRQPMVNAFWRQMMGNQMTTYCVLADGTLLVLEDTLKRHITLYEYERKNFDQIAGDGIADPDVRRLVVGVFHRHFTGLGDAELARRVTLVSAASGYKLEVVMARNLAMSQLSRSNLILLGSRRANPWVGLYEEQLNFRTEFQELPQRRVRLVNSRPDNNEEPYYEGQWGKLGYCRVAFLANGKGAGNVLLISGTDVQSSEAGGEFVTSELWMSRLKQRLGVREDEAVPHFEALLRARVVNMAVADFDLVALRRR